MRYDAFISYSHIADREHAATLQRALQRLARPFYRLKALNVFRDETNLVTDPRLWPSIERALGDSHFFVLLASPPAAESPWCAKEVAWWLEHRSVDTLLIAVTSGEIAYDEAHRDFDWSRTTALPLLLRGRFLTEPMHCDLRWAKRSDLIDGGSARFRSALLPLAAALHGIEPQALDGEDLRQFRRARRFWRATGAGLVALTVTSLVAMGVALRKEREAEHERQVAVARRLAAEAESIRLGRALASTRAALVAVEAGRRFKALGLDSVELDHSLRTSLSLMPPRPTSLAHAGAAALAFSADGQHVLGAGLDGVVGLWDLATGRELAHLTVPVVASEVAISPDLAFVAFSAEGDVHVWSVPEGRRVFGWSHHGKVTALAFSPNSRQLASGALDREVRVVALADGRELAKLVHGAAIERIAFSADGGFLATATGSMIRRMLRQRPEDEAAHVWDLRSGLRVAHLAHEHVVSSVAFSADGARLATGTLGGIARVWDIATQRELAQTRHPDGVAFIGFFPDGRSVASASRPLLVGSHDQTVQVWDATSGQERGRVTHPDAVRDLAFSPDGRWVASISNDGSARLIGADGREAARAPVPGLPSVLRFAPDSRRLLVGSPRRIVVLPAEGGFGPARVGLPARVSHVVVAPAGSAVTTVEGSAELVVRDAATLAPTFRVAHDKIIVGTAFSSDGRVLGTASIDGTARLWNATDGAPLHRLEHGGELRALSFAPDGRTLATASADGTACIWQVDTGALLRRVAVGTAVRAVQLDGTRLLVASDDGALTVWEQNTGQLLMSLETGLSDPSIVVGPDSRQVAIFGFARTLWLVDLTSGREVARLMHEDSVSNAIFLPDGRLVTGTWGGRLRLWGGGGPSMQAQAQHDAEVTALALSADGRFIASGSSDRTARLWHANDLGAIASLPHPIAISALAFDPSGRRLWAGTGGVLSNAGALRSWSWQLADLVDEACARADRNLSLDEWHQLLPGEPYRRSCPGLPLHVSVLVEDLAAAQAAAQHGREPEAQRRYAALAKDAADTDDAALANQACWVGSLDGAARAILPLCERAVFLSPGDFRVVDSRGLARAMSGDAAGALADFDEYIEMARQNRLPLALVSRRQAWVQALREGRDPFDPATRSMLRKGE